MKKIVSVIAFSFLLCANTFGVTLKVGVLAPEGTNWSNSLKKMAKEIREKTNKKVKIKFYFGGSQGDEPDVLRKIRVGQLHGGIFTGTPTDSVANSPSNLRFRKCKGLMPTFSYTYPYFYSGLQQF